MPDPPQNRFRRSIRRILGLPDSAPPERVRSLAARLQHHIEERLERAPDEKFAEARRQELLGLNADLERATSAPRIHPGGRRGVGLLGFLGGTLAGAGTVALALFYAAPGTESDPRTPDDPARLSVDADPHNSTWRLYHAKEEYVAAEGATDGQSRIVAPGSYRLRVDNPACPDEWERPVELPPGESRRYAPTLCQGEGELIVEASEPEARLKIDGGDVGPALGARRWLRTGSHTVALEKAGFEPWEGKVSISSEAPVRLQAKLIPRLEEAQCDPNPVAGAPEPGGSATPAEAPPPPPPSMAAAPPSPTAPSPAAASGSPPLLARQGTGKGGSKSWHDAIRHQLVGDYDTNGSGSLDLQAEIQSIPCSVLLSVENSYESGGLAVEMVHLYGFDGSDAPANTLGITPAMRAYAYDRMKDCGLRTRL